MKRRVTSLLVLLAIAGCKGTPVTPTSKPGPAAASTAKPAPAPTATPGPLASTAAQPAPASLAGVVQAPATLISDRGAGLISDRGAGLISDRGAGLVSNNGSNFGQVPLSGVRVALFTAADQPVRDAAGQPLVATTDAQGRYRFEADLPANNLVARVELPDELGQLSAIAARGVKVADLDLVSTLTTRYILDKYVKDQPDPVVTLDRLPGDVEASTRGKAQTALAAGSVPLPDGLTAAKVLATVESLRKSNTDFDAQLETVKRLLIPGGQSNFGAGLPATEVKLTGILGILPGPDGTLYVGDATGKGRLWRREANGNLVSFREGQLFSPIGLDGRGRVLAIQQFGYSLDVFGPDFQFGALGQDGKDEAFLPKGPGGFSAVQRDGVLQLYRGSQHWTVKDDGLHPEPALTLAGDAASNHVYGLRGLDAEGRLYSTDNVLEYDALGMTARVLDVLVMRGPAGSAPERWLSRNELGAAEVVIGRGGEAYTRTAAGELGLVRPDGKRETLGSGFNGKLTLAYLAADGSSYVVLDGSRVLHVKAGKAERIAGLETADTPEPETNASELALQKPSGIAGLPGGGFVVGDVQAHQVYRYRPDGKVEVLAGNGKVGHDGDGGPASQASLDLPTQVAADGQGNVYVLDRERLTRPPTEVAKLHTLARVRKIGTDGRISDFFQPAPEHHLVALLCDGDQVLVFQEHFTGLADSFDGPLPAFELLVTRLDAGGKPTSAAAGTSVFAVPAASRDGALYYWNSARIYRGTASEAPKELGLYLGGGTKANGYPATPTASRALAVDARGRCYMLARLQLPSGYLPHILRFDPADKSLVAIAGRTATLFNGTTPDESLGEPLVGDVDTGLAFAADGSLLVVDPTNRQIKRIPAERL